ncbi:MAG TPA: esterase-like activity of phytase family protein, partial [Chitinophagaceae bacterium]|nr:esterase-like activity of phytase family protein [Chitinophagaceae bacterium]
MRHLLFALGIIIVAGCFPARKTAGKKFAAPIKEIHFINEYILPNDIQFKNTVIGGLSGIDYDQARDVYYMICDDPSSKGPTRFYTAKLLISNKGIDSVVF